MKLMVRADRCDDVDEAVIFRFLDGSRGERLIQSNAAGLAVNILENVHDVLGIEGNRDVRTIDFSRNILFGIADFRIVGRDVNLIFGKVEFDDVVDADSRNQGNAVNGSREGSGINADMRSKFRRDDAFVVRELTFNQT